MEFQDERVMSGSPMNERRKEARQRKFRAGKIVFDGKSVIDCVVRNLTDTGANLELVTQIRIPDSFELTIPGSALAHKCRVIWREPKRIGVSFS
jgi:hypothetical protein